MDNEIWRWLWLGMFVVFGVGELLTAGFFLLPLAAGALGAFILSVLDVHVAFQWVAFSVISVAAVVWLQRFARRDDGEQPALGANRYVGKTALVLEGVDRLSGEGRVRMDTEMWRATTEGESIAAGEEVRVIGVIGSRLVVATVENQEDPS